MSPRRESIQLQAELHAMIPISNFRTLEDYCLYLLHMKAYETAADMAQDKIALDCGCNIGYGAHALGAKCKKVVGVDVSQKAIDEAQRRFGSEKIAFQVVDGNRLPFEDKYFDMVVSFHVIEHINDYESYLSEINRALKENGIAIFTTPNARIRLDPGMKPYNPFHVYEFGADDLEELLQKYFSQVQVRGVYASEPLYAVEYQRAQRSLERIHRRPKWINALSYYLRGHFSEKKLNFLRTLLHVMRGEKKPDESLMQQYSTADIFYRDDDLKEALELMAICHK